MTITIPNSVSSDGTVKVAWVPTIANPSAPKLTELSAASALELSFELTRDGFTEGGDEQTATDDRLGLQQDIEMPGSASDTLDVKYVYDPQATEAVRAYQVLKPGTEGYLVSRRGIPAESPWAVGQVVDVTPVKCGRQRKQPPEKNSVLRTVQKMFVRGQKINDVKTVA